MFLYVLILVLCYFLKLSHPVSQPASRGPGAHMHGLTGWPARTCMWAPGPRLTGWRTGWLTGYENIWKSTEIDEHVRKSTQIYENLNFGVSQFLKFQIREHPKFRIAESLNFHISELPNVRISTSGQKKKMLDVGSFQFFKFWWGLGRMRSWMG